MVFIDANGFSLPITNRRCSDEQKKNLNPSYIKLETPKKNQHSKVEIKGWKDYTSLQKQKQE